MSIWDTYPETYREKEVQAILGAVRAGECVSVVGLSGAGKSNLMGFLVNRVDWEGRFILVDGNRLRQKGTDAFFRLILNALDSSTEGRDPVEAVDRAISIALDSTPGGVCLVLDRFDALDSHNAGIVAGNLRALRDAYKYQLTLVTATRRPLPNDTELAELVFANTIWLGPLSESDTRWNVERYAARKSLNWGNYELLAMRNISAGYPSLLRAVSEAHSLGCLLDLDALRAHPAVVRRVFEFWNDSPTPEMITATLLDGNPLLATKAASHSTPDTSKFTAKEKLLYDYLTSHPNVVNEKDDLIRAVWPEDQIYQVGVRDDSLAQLIRRLRKKIEPDASNPQFIQTVPGRGYVFRKE